MLTKTDDMTLQEGLRREDFKHQVFKIGSWCKKIEKKKERKKKRKENIYI